MVSAWLIYFSLVTVRLLRKWKILWAYARTGIQLGTDLPSKWLLASLLLRYKWRLTRKEKIYRARIQIGLLRCVLHLRAADIFLVHEVLGQSPYIHPGMLGKLPRCIIDLGAHIDLATLRFKAAFPEVEIHCYEPDP